MRFYYTYGNAQGTLGYGRTSVNLLDEAELVTFMDKKSEEMNSDYCITFIQKLES